MYDFELQLIDRESVEPGQQVRARLIPASPESWPARQRGQRVRIHEGRKHVGDAYIEEVRLRAPPPRRRSPYDPRGEGYAVTVSPRSLTG